MKFICEKQKLQEGISIASKAITGINYSLY